MEYECHKLIIFFLIGAGITVGVLRFVSKRAIPTSANWAVGTFMGVSAISFEACQMERKQKIEKMKLIVKATDSRPKPEDKMVVTERGKNGAFNVVIETPAAATKNEE
jgi:hypothetical protein